MPGATSSDPPGHHRRDRWRSRWADVVATPRSPEADALWADISSRTPCFVEAVLADARVTAAKRGDRFEHRSRLDGAIQAIRLALVTDAFGALICYRARAALRARGVPLLPYLFHRLSVGLAQVSIGNPVVIAPGVYIPHGQVVVDGMTTLHESVVLSPFVTVGLRGGDVVGPVIGPHAYLGAGAKVIGPVSIGEGAQIGANAVVLENVPAYATAVGVPARLLPRGSPTPDL